MQDRKSIAEARNSISIAYTHLAPYQAQDFSNTTAVIGD